LNQIQHIGEGISAVRKGEMWHAIVDYLGQQYIVGLKIWRGDRCHKAGEEQIVEYLNDRHLDVGYMLSFNFNQKKDPGVKRVEIDGKILYEGTV
jgi:hypothetical protein